MNREWQVQIHLGLLIIFTELNGKNTHSFYNSKLHIFGIYDSYASCYLSKSSYFPLTLETSSMVKRATLTCPLTMRRNRAKNFQAYLSLSQYLKCFKINIIWLTWKSLCFSLTLTLDFQRLFIWTCWTELSSGRFMTRSLGCTIPFLCSTRKV